jgi:hypothetical protein
MKAKIRIPLRRFNKYVAKVKEHGDSHSDELAFLLDGFEFADEGAMLLAAPTHVSLGPFTTALLFKIGRN